MKLLMPIYIKKIIIFNLFIINKYIKNKFLVYCFNKIIYTIFLQN